jgi:hypothetical protein
MRHWLVKDDRMKLQDSGFAVGIHICEQLHVWFSLILGGGNGHWAKILTGPIQ